MALGQEQGNSTTQSFNSTKSFAGNISQFHLWNKELDKVQIKNMSNYCHCNSTAPGNAVIWSEFLAAIRGMAQIRWNSTCNATGIVPIP